MATLRSESYITHRLNTYWTSRSGFLVPMKNYLHPPINIIRKFNVILVNRNMWLQRQTIYVVGYGKHSNEIINLTFLPEFSRKIMIGVAHTLLIFPQKSCQSTWLNPPKHKPRYYMSQDVFALSIRLPTHSNVKQKKNLAERILKKPIDT